MAVVGCGRGVTWSGDGCDTRCLPALWDFHLFEGKVKMAVIEGEIESAVAQSIWLEIPLGPEAVCNLSEASNLQTSASLQVTLLIGA